MARKYHSGRMPAGAGANGSAFVPSSHGKNAASAASTASATYHHITSRSTKLGTNGSAGFSPAFSRCSTLGGTLMPWRWTNSRCRPSSTVVMAGSTATWKP